MAIFPLQGIELGGFRDCHLIIASSRHADAHQMFNFTSDNFQKIRHSPTKSVKSGKIQLQWPLRCTLPRPRFSWQILSKSSQIQQNPAVPKCAQSPVDDLWSKSARCVYPDPQEHYIHEKHLRKFILGSLHQFHVIHCASRDYTWKTRLVYVIDGIGHYIEKSVENNFGVIT